MRVVVFGGTGFVGLNVAEGLLAAGHEVIAFDRHPEPAEVAFEGAFRAAIGDVADATAVTAELDGADAVVYGAAITSNAASEATLPSRVLQVNLMGLLTVLEAARAAGVKRVVNLSSASAYGAAAFGPDPLDEAATMADPWTLYAITKFAGERVGARMRELWGLDVRSLRLSAVFGPWERATGVRDTLSPPFQIVQALVRGEPAILERADARDWLYAPDVATAVRALLEAEAPAHDLYNVGLGRTYELLPWAERVAARLGGGEVRLARPGEAPTILAHMPQSRQRLAADRLADLGVRCAFGLEESADHYADWAAAHRSLLTG